MSVVCDSRTAAGKFTAANGDVYEGECKDDKRNGKGEPRMGGGERSRAVEVEG